MTLKTMESDATKISSLYNPRTVQKQFISSRSDEIIFGIILVVVIITRIACGPAAFADFL